VALNDSPVARKYLGKIYYRNKEFDNAIRELEKSLELDPNQQDIKNSLLKMQSGYTVFKELK
jgi:tetratricopeptide (TPR) repeat protein